VNPTEHAKYGGEDVTPVCIVLSVFFHRAMRVGNKHCGPWFAFTAFRKATYYFLNCEDDEVGCILYMHCPLLHGPDVAGGFRFPQILEQGANYGTMRVCDVSAFIEDFAEKSRVEAIATLWEAFAAGEIDAGIR
jgi:hypothetical protein